jgi:hypothetical protein
VGALPDIVIGLGLLVGFLAAYGMLYGYNYSLGPVLRGIAFFLNNLKVNVWFISVNVGAWLGKEFIRLDHAIQHILGAFVQTMDRLLGLFFHANARLVEQIAQWIDGIGRDTVTVIHSLGAGRIKKAVGAAVAPLRAQIAHVNSLLSTARATIKHDLAIAQKQIRAAIHATTVALPRSIGRVGGRVGHLERDLVNKGKRIKSLEKKLTVAGLTGLVTAVLVRKLGLGWLRCNNVGRAGRAVCGMDSSLLEALLLDAAALTVAFNLEEFARELQTVTGEAARLIHNFAE